MANIFFFFNLCFLRDECVSMKKLNDLKNVNDENENKNENKNFAHLTVYKRNSMATNDVSVIDLFSNTYVI